MTDATAVRDAIDALGGCDAVADEIGINPRTVRRWYAGARVPGTEARARLSKALDDRMLRIQTLMFSF